MRLALFALLLAACAEDVAKDKAAAVVSEPKKEDSPVVMANKVAADFVPVARTIDPARSSVKALGAKVTGQHSITFPTFTATITADRTFVSGLEFSVQVADLQTEPEKLVDHLKSPDFFDVAQYPTATFASTNVVKGEGDAHTVQGNLTLRGVTKEVSFPATIAFGADAQVTGHAEFAINRKDFGIVYPGKPDNLIQDNVVLTVDFVAVVAEPKLLSQ
jgi:polyisoprenoid-binding protein YceI